MNREFWNSKRVLITGHTGFKGGWLSTWLADAGCDVLGYSLEPATQPSFYELCGVGNKVQTVFGDIRDTQSFKDVVLSFRPEIVFRLAAQPLVRQSYVAPIETYETNVIGTAKVLEALREIEEVRSIVCVTTDKCYENNEWVWPYRETDALGGYDPYSSSKACSEIVVSAYRSSFFDSSQCGLATVRAGNVIGGGDFSDDRLLPDFFRAITEREELKIRSPSAIRPWQHVLDPLAGYIKLAQRLYEEPETFSEAWNFGPDEGDAKSVEWIVTRLCESFDGAIWSLEGESQPHEAGVLRLDSSKSKSKLDWQPCWNLAEALRKSCDWVRAHAEGSKDMSEFSLEQIKEYESAIT